VIELDRLRRMARSFDLISDELEARYSATSFVRWLEISLQQEGKRNERAGKPGQRLRVADPAVASDEMRTSV
jgi:hypothetical protein